MVKWVAAKLPSLLTQNCKVTKKNLNSFLFLTASPKYSTLASLVQSKRCFSSYKSIFFAIFAN